MALGHVAWNVMGGRREGRGLAIDGGRNQFGHAFGLHGAVLELPLVVLFQRHGADAFSAVLHGLRNGGKQLPCRSSRSGAAGGPLGAALVPSGPRPEITPQARALPRSTA